MTIEPRPPRDRFEEMLLRPVEYNGILDIIKGKARDGDLPPFNLTL